MLVVHRLSLMHRAMQTSVQVARVRYTTGWRGWRAGAAAQVWEDRSASSRYRWRTRASPASTSPTLPRCRHGVLAGVELRRPRQRNADIFRGERPAPKI